MNEHRRTGRTTRMLKEAISHIEAEPNTRAVVMANTMASALRMAQLTAEMSDGEHRTQNTVHFPNGGRITFESVSNSMWIWDLRTMRGSRDEHFIDHEAWEFRKPPAQ